MKRYVLTALILTAIGLGFRVYVALRLANDAPDDGRAYAQLARNLLDHHGYTVANEPPYYPTYDRVPGYPVFLAGVYRIFGRDNNKAVRLIQGVLDTATCWMAALIAFLWSPADWSREKRRRGLLIALALALGCPFLAIYVGTILTEVPVMFLEASCMLGATIGLKSESRKTKAWAWIASGAAGGLATMLRPDAAMFVGAAGLTIVITELVPLRSKWRGAADRKKFVSRALGYGAALSAGFVIAMAPWTIRNARVFKVFQPVAPVEAAMPDEFVPYGYISWLKTWVDDDKWVGPFEWNIDYQPIHLSQLPDYAFDSAEEKARVASILDQYNREEPGSEISGTVAIQKHSGDDDDDDDDNSPEDDDTGPVANANKVHQGPDYNVQLTPELDGQFGQIAQERISRHPFRYYVVVRFKRAVSLWFDTHSQYYPFDGELFPLSKLDKDRHQQYWLPLFMFITLAYTALGLWGAWVLITGKDSARWVLLLGLVSVLRIGFLSTMENPEPRYVVELFPYVAALGAVALATLEFTRLRAMFARLKTRSPQEECPPAQR